MNAQIAAKALIVSAASVFLLSGCLVAAVGGAVVGTTAAVVGGTVHVAGAVVGGAVNTVTGGSQADKDKRDAKKYREEHKDDT
jgi:hypothetical protein